MRRIIRIKSTLYALLIVCICSLSSCKHKIQNSSQSTEYKTLDVALSDATVFEQYSASIRGKQAVEIRPQISGLITDILIDEGTAVRKGDALFIIDQVPYQAALKEANANVTSAEAKVATAQLVADNKQKLYDENIISEYDLQTAKNSLLESKANLTQAQASELNAKNNLSYTVIKSPVNGVVGMIPYRVGSLVNSSISDPLVTVTSEEEMYAYFSITESALLDLTGESGSFSEIIKNMPSVKLQLSNGKEYDCEGKIDAISGTIDTQTGAIGIRASFPNPSKLLRNGGSGIVIIPHNRPSSIVIPQSATYEIQDKIYVYKVVDGKATSAEIKILKINDRTQYIVESGLSVGDVIISEGAGLVREGTVVQSSTSK